MQNKKWRPATTQKTGRHRKAIRVGQNLNQNEMKKLFLMAALLLSFGEINAQAELDLTNKIFLQNDEIPNSTTELFFTSKNQVTYIITNEINGKTYIDKCPGKATLSGNNISIICTCADKELYPDSIKDSFIYDSKNKTLISTSFRSRNGVYFVWSSK